MKREITYNPVGVCSRQMVIVLDDDIIDSVRVIGGCPGNTLGVASLVKGMKVEEAIKRLEGIRCGMKSTSCPDQLSKALRKAL